MSAGTETSDAVRELEAKHRAELDAQREEFHRELARRAMQIGTLEVEVRRVAETYESSISWRLTRPIRGARTLLARLRRS